MIPIKIQEIKTELGYGYSFVQQMDARFLCYYLTVYKDENYEIDTELTRITYRKRSYTADDIINGQCQHIYAEINPSKISKNNIEAKYGKHSVFWNYAIRLEIHGGAELLDLRTHVKQLDDKKLIATMLWETSKICRRMKQYIIRKYHYGE
jgi:hypothetical protein